MQLVFFFKRLQKKAIIDLRMVLWYHHFVSLLKQWETEETSDRIYHSSKNQYSKQKDWTMFHKCKQLLIIPQHNIYWENHQGTGTSDI